MRDLVNFFRLPSLLSARFLSLKVFKDEIEPAALQKANLKGAYHLSE